MKSRREDGLSSSIPLSQDSIGVGGCLVEEDEEKCCLFLLFLVACLEDVSVFCRGFELRIGDFVI